MAGARKHHHALAHAIIADRGKSDDPRPAEGREYPTTIGRPDYRKGRWRPAVHRGADKQYLERAFAGDVRAHGTAAIAQGSRDAKRRADGTARPSRPEPQGCADC